MNFPLSLKSFNALRMASRLAEPVLRPFASIYIPLIFLFSLAVWIEERISFNERDLSVSPISIAIGFSSVLSERFPSNVNLYTVLLFGV